MKRSTPIGGQVIRVSFSASWCDQARLLHAKTGSVGYSISRISYGRCCGRTGYRPSSHITNRQEYQQSFSWCRYVGF